MSGPLSKEEALRKPRLKSYMTTLLIIVLFFWSGSNTETSIPVLIEGMPEMGKLLYEMVPPDWGYIDVVWAPMVETVQMAIIGTTIGGLLAIPIALLAAGNVTRTPWIYQPARIILNLIRTIPELLYAGLFVAIFGIGAAPGVLALIFFSFGLIAKLTFESIESVDPGPLEAMTAVGANKLQWIHFGVLPQVASQYMAYFLYTFEVNVRAAAVLGLVGAGGIGLYLDRTLQQFRYDRSSLIIILTLAIVLFIDYVSTKVREKLL